MAKLIRLEDHTEKLDNTPTELPVLPLRNTVAYPFSMLPLVVGIQRSVKLVKDA
jgi:ATP-dependent Lon protease